MTEQRRFTDAHLAQWRNEGFAIIPGFFSPEEYLPIRKDYEDIYGTSGEGQGAALETEKSELGIGTQGEPRLKQFKNIDTLPFEGSVTMNLLSLHPALIDFAKALLNVDEVFLYQSHTWVKYTGETDYEQDFHCDFSNHTLLVPSDETQLRTVDFIVYFTDVTDAHGALHYVTKSDAEAVLGPGRLAAATPEKQSELKERQCSAAGPAGTLVAHSIDTFHRGTNLTKPDGYRFTMTIGYKAAGNDMVGFHVWQQTPDRDWSIILNNATPDQLVCLGVPLPGDTYWSMRTLKLTQARWPNWNMQPYFEAFKLAS